MEKLKSAQELIKCSNVHVSIGFDRFIYGDRSPNYQDGINWYSELQGYEYAKKMAKEESIAFTYVFKCKESNCYPFMYGGFFVCNDCGRKGVDKEWWKIKVEKYGNEFCCHGLDFTNITESSNYAFGKTFEESISNYGKIMLKDN